MAEDGGFKHIKVTPAREQEVVIHAGAARAAAPQSKAQGEEQCEAGPKPAPDKAQASVQSQVHHGTTLDDIRSSKMPKTQVVIIVLAVCAIIAFAVWYAFFS